MSIKFRLVCATREPEERFHTHTALGRSLALLPYPFVEVRLFASNSAGLPKLYNIALREAASDPAILVFLHDDLNLSRSVLALPFDRCAATVRHRRTCRQQAPGAQATGMVLYRTIDGPSDDWTNLSGVVAHGSNGRRAGSATTGRPIRR